MDELKGGGRLSGLKFSIIIPNYNGRHFLKECLASIENCHYPKNAFEIILVDNGSIDGSVEFAQELSPGIRIIRLDINTGFASAINSGATAAQGEFLVLLNNDMRVSPHWLSAYEDVAYGAGADCITGRILSWDAKKIDFLEGILLFDGHALQRYQGAPVSSVADLKIVQTFIACGGNMAVRRSLFLELAGFDNMFFAYTEDVDFSWRLNASGISIYFAPEATVYHHHQGTSNSLGVYNRGFLYERNAFLNLFKNIDDPYFSSMLHTAWLTLIHRTREIITLNASKSAILGQVPFSNPGLTNYDIPAETNLSYKFLTCLRTRGILWSIGKNLERIGLWVQKMTGENSQNICTEIDMGHPHIVSQLQAIWYILANLEPIYQKRLKSQAYRKVSDKLLFTAFPPWVVSTYPGDKRLFNSTCFRDLLPAEIGFRFADIKDVHGGA